MLKYFLENIAIQRKFTNFAIPNQRIITPNQLIINDLRTKQENY